MALNPSNSSNMKQLALKGLIIFIHSFIHSFVYSLILVIVVFVRI